VDLPVYPGERLSVKLVDVHVSTGYWRMAVQGMLDSPVSTARAAAALAEVATEGEEGLEEEGEEVGGQDGLLMVESMAAMEDGLGSEETGTVAAAAEAAATAAAAAMAAGLVFGVNVATVVAPPVAAAAGL
jgi:hypothetical protein